MNDDPAEQAAQIAQMWWVLFLGGLVSLVIGIMLLVWPSRTLELIAILLGIDLLLVGVIQVILAIREHERSRTGTLLLGAVAGIAGLLVIRDPGGSLTLIALAVGIYLVLAGAMRLVAAFGDGAERGWRLLGAVVDLAIGVLIVSWPQFGVASFAVLVGIGLVLRGVIECLSALALRSVNRILAEG